MVNFLKKKGLLPGDGKVVKPVILKEFDMQPRGAGASAHASQWHRSEYTMLGSHYLVYFQLIEGNVIFLSVLFRNNMTSHVK